MDSKEDEEYNQSKRLDFQPDKEGLYLDEQEGQSITVDDLIEKVGGCGRFQVAVEVIICAMAFAIGFQNLMMYFVGHSPKWKCVEVINGSNTECNIIGEVESSNALLYNSRCQMSRRSWDYVTERDFSIVTELDLVCNASGLGTLVNSGFYIGWGIGAIPLGILSDKMGRKPVFFVSFTTVMIATIILAYSSTFAQFFTLRIVTGVGQSGFSLTSYILASENVSPEFRAATGNMLFVIFVLAFLALDFQAYFVPRWRSLVLMCSVPYVILVFFFFYIPESLRWLTAKKRLDKAKNVLQRMAKTNKRQLYNINTMLPRLAQKRTDAKGSFLDILCHGQLLRRSLNQGFAWFVCGMTYYGISLASADLTGSLYRDFALTSIVEIPSIFVVIYGVERFGRKKVVPFSLCISGVLCTFVAFVPEKSTVKALPLLRVVFGMLGKFFNSIAFNGFFVWSTELYPTVIRTQGLSFVFFMARVGASSAPFITNGLRLIHPAIPFILMGTTSLLSGLLTIVLPETRGKPMPETLEDVLTSDPLKSPVGDNITLTPLKSTSAKEQDSDNEDVCDEKAALL